MSDWPAPGDDRPRPADLREPAGQGDAGALTGRPVVRDGWRRCCQRAGLPWVASDTGGDAAGAQGPAPCGSVVLVDLPLATGENIGVLRSTGWMILLLAPNIVSAELLAAFAAGVDGLVTTSDQLATLDDALAHLRDGRSYVSPTGARLLLDGYCKAGGRSTIVHDVALSVREREVLRSMVDGLTTKAIARRLGIATKTVEAHRSRIFDRLGVRTQREAVTRALREPGLLGGR